MRGLKNFESALDFTESYLAYYNYLRPHESLDNKTPAEVAGISYPHRNWDDVIRNYKPKAKIVITHIERESFKMPKTHIGRPHKIRKPKPSGRNLGGGVYLERSGRRHIRI
jgi:hypothetical protein